MDCETARERLIDDLRGRLSVREHAELQAHVATCEACRGALEIERVTDDLIGRIPRFEAPAALKRELRARVARPSPPPARPRRRPAWTGAWTGALVVLMLGAAAITVARLRGPDPESQSIALLQTELVNDHLRVLYAEHPLDVVSTGIHDVKPWFAGKLDFAPPVAFAGDADFPLQGGSVAYVIDRKAADFVFKRRLHTISLFVLPAAGLGWPPGDTPLGRVQARVRAQRGFHVVQWRDGEFAYALVSDVDPKELLDLGARIAQ